MNTPIKIYLGDLVHTWEKASTWTFPLNIGFISAYAKKHLGDQVEFRLFKRPEVMIEAIKSDPPDVVGLGYYVWNANLNGLVCKIAKQANADVFTVGGGPNFTSINTTPDQAAEVFQGQRELDAYVVNQGERGFVEIMKAYIEADGDVGRVRTLTVDGCVVNADAEAAKVNIGEPLAALRELDEIPSPYLTGILDEFFDEPFAPVLETNRSCPYRCTFCAWGIGTAKMTRFAEDRVFEEIDYIGQRCKNAAQMFIADANFGMLHRDADIARHLNASHKKYGFPGHLAVQWHKSRPDLIIKAAREVKDISRIGASMQSMHPETLEAVKRKNLPLEDVKMMLEELSEDGQEMPLVSELILGLPEETRESHLEANRTMIDAGAEMINYNLYLLPGTEMDSKESREKYFKETGFRLMDNAFGVYDGVAVFEGQETVQATSTMSRDELRGFRFYHFLLQFMWGGRWYYDYINLFRGLGVHPVDLIDRICQTFPRDEDSPLGKLFQAFKADHDLETFKTYEDMCAYWSQPDHLERLRTGGYGKLNYAFTYKVLLECRAEFDAFLLDMAAKMADESAPDNARRIVDITGDILNFGAALQVKLNEDMSLVPTSWADFGHDILGWREGGYQGLPAASEGNAVHYKFTVSDAQNEKLTRLLRQYASHNKNLTLRKMSEYIKPHEFFYTAETTDERPDEAGSGDTPLVPQSGTHDSWSHLNDKGKR